ncbi:efflux RND transporter periplasmic adaptor subunit [Rhabdobacter roseus]|uniref:Membrane fusion protein (Multidrug efflux system) n=1 Tax=Rhabdobacter roseus TaxID=1655419 RepID=A0A840TVM9_9BACT|nr:efflux RND transporter periplasmic adaptor subunit [Rhabdobacter roseus]MBB5284188.1 membrane fusion protein (multidrug efflux system) [Rhabdobacter roseus]
MKGIAGLKLFVASLLVVGCTASSKEKETETEAVKRVPVVRLTNQKTDLRREYVGDINAIRNVEIYARLKGYLEEVYVDEGKPVRKGQVLFRINDEEYAAELAKAKANLQSAIAEAKAAELEVNRVKVLVEKKVISNTELEVAKARLLAQNARIEEARSAQDNASLRLSHTRIRAPFDGIVNRIPYKAGSLIDEGTLLTSVSDTKSVYVYFEVSEKEYLEFVKSKEGGQQNRAVHLKLADGTDFRYAGKIETMEGEFDESTGSIAFRASFPNPDKLLKHGSSGMVRLTNTLDNALLVPQKATFEIQDKSYVYVVDGKNQIRTRSFVPKSRFANYYVVESGLKPGETIVYEGIQTLRDGATISPQPISMDSLKVPQEEVRLTAK